MAAAQALKILYIVLASKNHTISSTVECSRVFGISAVRSTSCMKQAAALMVMDDPLPISENWGEGHVPAGVSLPSLALKICKI